MMSETNSSSFAWARLVSAISVCLCFAIPLIVVAMPRGERLLVITQPGSHPETILRIIAAADGRLVSSTRLDWIVVAQATEPDFASRLFAAGAVLVLDGSVIGACEADTNTSWG